MIKKISRCCFIFGKTLIPGFLLSIFTLTPLFSQTPVDLSGYLASSGIQVQLRNYLLYAQWNTLSGGRCNVRFDLRNGYPLFASLNMSRTGNSPFITIATGIDPRFDISAGSRPRDPWPYIFFDCVDARPYSRSTAHLELDSVKVKSEGARTTVSFSTLTAGVFSGELAVTIYNGSPLLHVEAVMTEEEPRVAYIYDALFSGAPPVVCYKDTSDRFIRTDPPDALTAYMVRHRTIIAEFPAGSLAVFPPPHAYVFP
ncbi:MAG: hypothetical protein JW881_10200, partial [Spirochaetales bacterium]|nr:hypothetical protein [Spirochaetales bacterium]